MTLVGCPSGKAYATTLEEVLALRSENAALRRRVSALEMVIAEEMHPTDCMDDANRMLAEDIYKRVHGDCA